MSWKWNTEPLSWQDKCAMCRQALRVQSDGGIVIWTDSKHYHVWCLLDRLALGSLLAPRATADGVSPWGLQPWIEKQRVIVSYTPHHSHELSMPSCNGP